MPPTRFTCRLLATHAVVSQYVRVGWDDHNFTPPATNAAFFHDKYEAVNVWSHLIPGIFFAFVGYGVKLLHLYPAHIVVHSLMGFATGILAYTIFGISAATMHLCSCAAHIYPDSHSLEKLDHFGITGLILGTSISALVAMQHGGPIPRGMLYACAVLGVSAMLRPVPRVIGFTLCSVAIVVVYAKTIANWNLAAQLAMYLTGAWCFLRCVVWAALKHVPTPVSQQRRAHQPMVLVGGPPPFALCSDVLMPAAFVVHQ